MKLHALTVIAVMTVTAIIGSTNANAQFGSIDRYKVDFQYQNIGYQILSQDERTVAVCQNFDIDAARTPEIALKSPSTTDNVGPDGILMSYGLVGPFVVIPQTVYDEEGVSYTVTELADEAINWVTIQVLVLPPTLESLNHGICEVKRLSQINLPEGIKEIDGISYCNDLTSLQIPSNVEVIRKRSLFECGLRLVYLPQSVKTIEDDVMANCSNLEVAMLSELESMGSDCLKGCSSFYWANLPETLKTMGEGCFNDCPSLDLVSLPWSEIKMDACFNGCPNISRIEVLAVEPNPFPEGSFLDVDRSTCTLAVPEGSEDKYREAEGWKEFLNIVGDVPAITPSAVATVPTAGFRAFTSKGTLHIINPTDTAIEVYAINGEKVASLSKSGLTELSLPTGVYIVSSPFGSRKVAIN